MPGDLIGRCYLYRFYESFKNDFQIKHNSQHNIFQEDILIEIKHNLQHNISQVNIGLK